VPLKVQRGICAHGNLPDLAFFCRVQLLEGQIPTGDDFLEFVGLEFADNGTILDEPSHTRTFPTSFYDPSRPPATVANSPALPVARGANSPACPVARDAPFQPVVDSAPCPAPVATVANLSAHPVALSANFSAAAIARVANNADFACSRTVWASIPLLAALYGVDLPVGDETAWRHRSYVPDRVYRCWHFRDKHASVGLFNPSGVSRFRQGLKGDQMVSAVLHIGGEADEPTQIASCENRPVLDVLDDHRFRFEKQLSLVLHALLHHLRTQVLGVRHRCVNNDSKSLPAQH